MSKLSEVLWMAMEVEKARVPGSEAGLEADKGCVIRSHQGDLQWSASGWAFGKGPLVTQRPNYKSYERPLSHAQDRSYHEWDRSFGR